jgi:hypothetical protein
MLLFLLAVAAKAGKASPEMDLALLLPAIADERSRVEHLHRLASLVTAAAVALTAAALAVGATSLSVDQDGGRLLLAPSGVQALQRVCERSVGRLHGTLDVPTLRSDFVLFTLDEGECSAAEHTTVRVPRADVAAFVEDPGN